MGKKGGDIDLLVVSKKIGYRERRRIRVELLKRLGDRKIDLLVVKDFHRKVQKFRPQSGMEFGGLRENRNLICPF